MRNLQRIVLIGCAALAAAVGQTKSYKPGDFQSSNPNYPKRNPFYFEGRIDWDLLKISTPVDAWEFAQRGIHKQDDLEDIPGAIADYRESLARNSLSGGTCQIVTSAPVGFGQKVDPPPCMFTVRLRLGYLLREDKPLEAIQLFREVLLIDPLRLEVNKLIGETYRVLAAQAADDDSRQAALEQAAAAFHAELDLSPVTPLSIKLTADEANNAHVHWALSQVYAQLSRKDDEARELDLYLKATKWHSDTYVWRIELAKRRLASLQH
jgi:tetratricopeptide (TPR) repeat protein